MSIATDTIITIGTLQGANLEQVYLHIEGINELISFPHAHGEYGQRCYRALKGTEVKITQSYAMGSLTSTIIANNEGQ